MRTERRELYRSPNGDSWYLAREPGDGRAFIIHQPNGPSGGQLSHIELSAFLGSQRGKPEQQALLRLIGTLVAFPPYGDRSAGGAPSDQIVPRIDGVERGPIS